jgi:archaemetzincin
MEKIILVIFSEIDSRYIAGLKTGLETAFKRNVEINNQINNLKYAYDRARNQYTSPRLLSRLRRMRKAPADKVMAVVDVDLYSPGYDFIYGEADVKAGLATLSIYRLRETTANGRPDSHLLMERIIREAVHEVGHLYGLVHCKNPKCVMRTCTCAAEVDEAGNGLCADCQGTLNPNLM